MAMARNMIVQHPGWWHPTCAWLSPILHGLVGSTRLAAWSFDGVWRWKWGVSLGFYLINVPESQNELKS